MATLSILLSAMAMLHQGADTPVAVPDEYFPAERSASKFDDLLGKANRDAADAARLQIGPMLDAAYQPAYHAVPEYADFH